ncbi:hypothetical protein V6N11_037703 [Hibiscus sabdariffa]|uniref:Uncharacterized protein n=2 Tax=Hibiscus sabdariffa TaxID=183260 RepID=A0ABR2PCB2_9ROSI
MKWSIDNGYNTSIWEDYWLSGQLNKLIESRRVPSLNRVMDLMLPNANVWNHNFSKSTFSTNDATSILLFLYQIQTCVINESGKANAPRSIMFEVGISFFLIQASLMDKRRRLLKFCGILDAHRKLESWFGNCYINFYLLYISYAQKGLPQIPNALDVTKPLNPYHIPFKTVTLRSKYGVDSTWCGL